MAEQRQSGIIYHSYRYLPECYTWIDTSMDHYAFNFASGGYLHWMDDRDCVVKLHAPLIWWTRPGVRYRYGCRDGVGWEHRWVAFMGEEADRLVADGLLPVDRTPPYTAVHDPARLAGDFDDLLGYLPGKRFGAARADHLLRGLLLHIHEQEFLPDPRAPHARELRELAAAIDHAPHRRWNFHARADRHCLSYSHFRKLFRDYFHTAPHRYVLRARLTKASVLLRESNHPVKRIAAEVGIDDLQYFTRLFTTHRGISPARYRRQFRL